MKILEIEVSNFLSFGEEQKLDLTAYESPCLVLGKTSTGSNGAGKSSFAQAVYWALTGESTRSINAADIIRNGAKKCSVRLKFEYGGKLYDICRVYSSTKKGLDILIDGVEQSFHDAKSATEFLFNSLGFKKNILEIVLFFGKGFSSFTESKNADKVELIEQITNVELFDKLSEKNSERLKSIEKDVMLENGRNQYIVQDKAGAELKLEKEVKDLQLYKDQNIIRIRNYKLEIEGLVETKEIIQLKLDGVKKEAEVQLDCEQERLLIDSHNNTIKEIRTSKFPDEEKLKKYNDVLTTLTIKKRDLEKELRIKKEEKASGKCSACGQALPNYTAGVQKKIEEQMRAIEKEIVDVVNNIGVINKGKLQLETAKVNFENTINADVVKYSNQIKDLNTVITKKTNEVLDKAKEVHRVEMQIKDVEQQIATKNALIAGLENDSGVRVREDNIFKLDKQVKELEIKLQESRDKLTSLNSTYLIAKYWETGLKDIKYSAFQNSLEILQNQISFYLRKMNFNFDTFVIDAFKDGSTNKKLTSINAFITRGNDVVAIGGLSQGEAQRVNLAFYFAVKRIIQEYIGIEINISFLDEVVDNMDENGRDCVFNLIVDYASEHNSQIFEMNHFPDGENRYSSILVIEKKDDVSYFSK